MKAPVVQTRAVEVELPAADRVVGKSADRLTRLVKEHATIAAEIKALEDRKSSLRTDIEMILSKAKFQPGSALVVASRYKVSLVQTTTGRLDKTALVEEGVSLRVIEKCTRFTTSTYPRIEDLQKD